MSLISRAGCCVAAKAGNGNVNDLGICRIDRNVCELSVRQVACDIVPVVAQVTAGCSATGGSPVEITVRIRSACKVSVAVTSGRKGQGTGGMVPEGAKVGTIVKPAAGTKHGAIVGPPNPKVIVGN